MRLEIKTVNSANIWELIETSCLQVCVCLCAFIDIKWSKEWTTDRTQTLKRLLSIENISYKDIKHKINVGSRILSQAKK